MAVQNIQRTFGQFANSATAPAQDKPKAQFWLNIGYDSGVVDENGESRFVSLPVGIPLDGMELLNTNSRNKEFAAFQAARNDLYEQIMTAAKSLEPGQSIILGDASEGLQVQLRRVNDDAAPVDMKDNQYARVLKF